MIWSHLDKYRDLGLLLLRVSFGLYMAFGHGLGKIRGGPEQWAQLGGVMEGIFGFGFLPTFWGFMAAFAEFICALLVALGFLSRPASILLVVNMFVAAMAHITGVIDGGPETALLYGAVFISLIFTGPGAYSIDGSTES
jgi:putative oxidoreductase